MGRRASAVVVALAVLALAAASARAEQLIVVVTDGWDAPRGELRRFARDGGPGTPWQAVGGAIPVVVGHAGLGWGAGLRPRPHAARGDGGGGGGGGGGGDGDGPTKREGDGRAPAGRFALGDVTGYDDAAPAGTRLRYRRATPALRCVDDPDAPAAYNRLADAPAATPPPWRSAERMRRDDELYRLTVFVRHNDARTPGAGSCIFLHVWADPSTPTVGCTAMALPDLRTVILWADPSTQLVQLPRAVYRRLARAWDLPLLQRK